MPGLTTDLYFSAKASRSGLSQWVWSGRRDTAAGPHREGLRHSPASSPGAQSSTWELSLQQGTLLMVPRPLPVSLLPSLSRTVCSHLPNKPFVSISCLHPASSRPHPGHTHTDQPGEESSPQFCCEIKTCLKRSTLLTEKKKKSSYTWRLAQTVELGTFLFLRGQQRPTPAASCGFTA